jgi:uncharacterized protein YndB with AHSA1/START domain
MTDTPIIASQVDAVTREVGTSTRNGAETRVASISQRYDTTIDDLWEACTTSERLARWFAPVTGELRLGGRYQVEGNASGIIETCEPPRSFSATWEYGDEVSWISVQITQDGGGARLTLEHAAPADAGIEFWERYGPGAGGVGWDLALLGLALHLGTGADRPAEADGFEATPEGRRFIIESSASWGEADAAAGTPRSDADARRDRTTAFYLGEEQPDA